MIESCVHTHSIFCDGRNTPAEMAEAAYRLGIKSLGFSGHSYVDIDDFGIKPERLGEYLSEIKRLKAEYDGRLEILCGLELDSFSKSVSHADGYDYIIGSVHAVRDNYGKYNVIDGQVRGFELAAEQGFDGDYYELCRGYYSQFADFILRVKPDIVGHFDLITKYNRNFKYFDECSDKYKVVALEGLEAAFETDAVIEVNTGGIARGYKDSPYPAEFLLKRIFEKKGRVIITTDAHNTDMLVNNTEQTEQLLKSIGFKSVCELSYNGFYERGLI